MTLAPYQGQYLLPGMLAEAYTVENDGKAILYGGSGLYTPVFVGWAVIVGTARDAGNTGYTTVLRPGLIMAQVTATQKWTPFVSGGSGGEEVARGILMAYGLSTQLGAADADKFMATILVGGIVNPEALCLTTSATYGLARTSVGLEVRKHLYTGIRFSDDMTSLLALPIANRNI
jgi:hypothetical protein